MCSFLSKRQVRLPILRLTLSDYRALHDAIRPTLEHTGTTIAVTPPPPSIKKASTPLVLTLQGSITYRASIAVETRQRFKGIGSLTDSTEPRTLTPQPTLASGEALVAVNWANKSEKTRLCVPSEPQD